MAREMAREMGCENAPPHISINGLFTESSYTETSKAYPALG